MNAVIQTRLRSGASMVSNWYRSNIDSRSSSIVALQNPSRMMSAKATSFCQVNVPIPAISEMFSRLPLSSASCRVTSGAVR